MHQEMCTLPNQVRAPLDHCIDPSLGPAMKPSMSVAAGAGDSGPFPPP